MFWLFLIVGMMAAMMVDLLLGFGTTDHVVDREPYGFWASWSYASGGGPLLMLFSVAMLIPSLAVGVRRLHDSDRRGWWLLIGLVPLIGSLILIVFMIISGTRGPNRFGEDPVERQA